MAFTSPGPAVPQRKPFRRTHLSNRRPFQRRCQHNHPMCVASQPTSGRVPGHANGTAPPNSGTGGGAGIGAGASTGSGMSSSIDDMTPHFGPKSVEAAIAAVARGEFIVVTDDEDRENEGDLICAADKVTPESIAFMVRHTSGVICAAMESDDLDRLQLSQMVAHNTDPKNTAFTVSVDSKVGTTTGISAADRARTLRDLARPNSTAAEFNRPGHIFPLRYRPGGVLKRAGHTEAAVDFARLAGCAPAGVLCEIVDNSNERGDMARLPYLLQFAEKHGLVVTSIRDLVQYRRKREQLVVMMGDRPARLPTKYGMFDSYAFRSVLDDVDHLALVAGGAVGREAFDKPVLVRVHSECCTGDVFGSLRCDCGPQLEYAMEQIAAAGRGVLIYLRGQEGRGIGLGHKMRAYALQDIGRDTVQANVELGLPEDSREYGIGAQMLAHLGVEKIRLMTNNPKKFHGISGYGLTIVERVPVRITPNPENLKYLKTKQTKMGHWLGFTDDETQSQSLPEPKRMQLDE